MKRKQGKSNTQQKYMYKCDDDITSFKYVQQKKDKQQETQRNWRREEKEMKIKNI